MITDELAFQIRQAMGLPPTEEQTLAIATVARFLSDHTTNTAMVLRGAAGTGKTTLAAAIVAALKGLGQKMVLMAPTGRAAKVFSLYAGHAAYTIHRRIYRQHSLEGSFSLNFNTSGDTLFIVDEASMIANSASLYDSIFANGQLLDDLINFVYGGSSENRNCRLLLIGDAAQLPPVGVDSSPALQADVLRCYGLKVYESELKQVVRQSRDSGILQNATAVRQMQEAEHCTLPKADINFEDTRLVSGDELIESLSSSYSQVGIDETLVITRSNKRANIYNHGIRNMILGREEQLSSGDLLMVVKNNYYWSTENGEQTAASMPFIANGDRTVVRRVRNIHEQYGFHFAEVTLSFPDYDDIEISAMALLDTLNSEAPALTHEQQELLYQRIMEDYADIPQKQERLKHLKTDRYYNALQIKFAYAATCHKAQGGQWAHVYIDQGYMTDDMLTSDYLHWLYTAFTRATERLMLVNWPETQLV